MTVKIKPSEQATIDAIANDMTDIETNGVQVQPSTPYAVGVYPIANLADSINRNPDLPLQLLDGTKGYFAPLIRRVGPITAQVYNLFPSATTFNISTGVVELLTYTFPEQFEVPRTVEVSVNGSGFLSGTVGTRMDFAVKVNGVGTQAFRNYLSTLTSPQGFAGSWIVTLPVGTVTVKAIAYVASGAGTINFDGNCFINMTIKG